MVGEVHREREREQQQQQRERERELRERQEWLLNQLHKWLDKLSAPAWKKTIWQWLDLVLPVGMMMLMMAPQLPMPMLTLTLECTLRQRYVLHPYRDKTGLWVRVWFYMLLVLELTPLPGLELMRKVVRKAKQAVLLLVLPTLTMGWAVSELSYKMNPQLVQKSVVQAQPWVDEVGASVIVNGGPLFTCTFNCRICPSGQDFSSTKHCNSLNILKSEMPRNPIMLD